MMALALGCFFWPFFAGVSPGPNFAEFQKTRAGGPLGKFDIARLHGHFGRGGLQQNVLLGWHFKNILVKTWWLWHQGVFSGLLFAGVSPGPNFAEFQKTRAGGPLCKFDIALLHGHFGRRRLQQNVLLGWHLKEILVRHDGIGARVFFLAFFLHEFPLVPTLQNFRKRALGVLLANLT